MIFEYSTKMTFAQSTHASKLQLKSRVARKSALLDQSAYAGLSTTVEEEKSRQELLESGFPSPQKPSYQREFSVLFWVNG